MKQDLKISGGGGLSEPLAERQDPSGISGVTDDGDATSSNSRADVAQLSEKVPLDQLSNENKNESAPAQAAGTSDVSSQVAGTVALPADASAVSIVSDGLVFEIDDTSKTATLVGSAATPPKGDLSVPASVTSGTSTYEVTSIAKNAFAKCVELTSVSLPATLREVDSDAVAGCSSLKSITVSAKNEAFASHDGMLFTKDYTRLLLIPEGMEGAANIPGSTTTVPAQALSRCLLMGSSLTAGDGSAAFTTRNGMLFSKDLKILVSCPPAIGNAVVLPAETETISEYALAGCKDLTSITALGNVREIDPTAFTEEVKATAKVALPAGESKAVWEQAGFQHFAEPAEPGTTSRPEADAVAASGLVYTLLDDYTLSVTWEGVEDPAAELEIPASTEINGVSYRVSTIAANAFANRGSLTSVKLPASITTIGEAAFAGCANLADIQLPGNLREIGERAFEATSLTNIWLPASVQSIGPRAFASRESLTRIVALGTPQVADDALAGCANLSIYCPYDEGGTYPWNLGLIANNNHLLPYGLALPEEPLALEVGQSVNLFDNGLNEAPEGCEVSYSYVAKPISVDQDGTVTGKAEGTSEVTATLALEGQELARTTRTVEVTSTPETDEPKSDLTPEYEPPVYDDIAEGMHGTNIIEPQQSASGLMVMSADVELMADGNTFTYAFDGGELTCKVLAESSGGTPGTCEVSAKNITADKLVIPEIVSNPSNQSATYHVTRIATWGFKFLSFSSVQLPSTLLYIGPGAFRACDRLESIVIPKSVTDTGFNPFMECVNLATITVEEGNTSIVSLNNVLYNAAMTRLIGGTPLTIKGSYSIPDGVESVDINAFELCTELTELYIPASLYNLGNGYSPFPRCSKLQSIIIDPANKSLAVYDGVIYGLNEAGEKVSLVAAAPLMVPANLVVPDTVTSIMNYAISKSPTLVSVYLPASVSDIGILGFGHCPNLKSFTSVRTDVLKMQHGGFLAKCTNLEEILIASSRPAVNIVNSEGGTQFGEVDKSTVKLHCPEAAASIWQKKGFDVAPFSTGALSTFALPDCTSTRTFGLDTSVAADSLFASKVELRHELSGASGITLSTSNAGRSATFSYSSGGSASLTSELVFTSPTGTETVLASSSSTVSVETSSGALPTALNASNTDPAVAGWSISPDGVLSITCASGQTIGDLGWTGEADDYRQNYWGPLRDFVKVINLPDNVTISESMAFWFADMTGLADACGVFIPQGVKKIDSLFSGCTALQSVPADLVRSTGLTSAERLFFECRSLESLPDAFVLPNSVSAVKYMFYHCSSLASLPDGFLTAQSAARDFTGMFSGTALATLPDNFAIPVTTDTIVAGMFEGCSRLTLLPASFRLAGISESKAGNAFKHVGSDPLPMYYLGEVSDTLPVTYWTSQNRVLATNPTELPQEYGLVSPMVSYEDDLSKWVSLRPLMTDGSGLITEPEAQQRATQVFTLWYTDEACTQRVDFSKPITQQVKPDQTGAYPIYGKYVPGTRGGELPCVPGTGRAFWSLSDDGVLYVRGAGAIYGFDWYDHPDTKTNHWAPYRRDIVSVQMCPSIRNNNFSYWFYGCTNLTDISGFVMPDNVVNVGSLFQKCSSLEVVPEGFSLASNTIDTYSMFAGSSIVALPSSFKIPAAVSNPAGMFYQCKKLASLPEGFRFTNPGVKLFNVLRDCPSLTSLPDGFSFPLDRANLAADNGAAPFGCDIEPGAARVVTYYRGDDPNVLNFDWASQNRTLVTDAGDRNAFTVTYRIGNDDGTWTTRSTALTNDDGLAPDLGTPSRDGYSFTGWCEDEDCLVPFDFSQPLDRDREIYGKWIKYGGRDKAVGGGQLPVVPDSGEAWWQITSDGTLMIMGDGKVKGLDWTWDDSRDNNRHWFPVRDEVRSIVMSSSIRAESMYCWFQRMANLVNIEKVRIPDDVQSISCLFFGCRNLQVIPKDFIIPESVTDVNSLFNGCSSLNEISNSFRLPSKVTTALCLFQGTSISTVPEALGESIASSKHLEVITRMFSGCSKLTSLPSTFALPESIKDAGGLFRGCISLKSLPEGFKVPDSVGLSSPTSDMPYMTEMFWRCDSLTYLPASFDFPLDIANKPTNPFLAGGTEKLKTYFAGGADSPSSVNSYNWEGQNREIVTTVPEGSVKVRFYLSDDTGAFSDVPWLEQLARKDAALDEPIVPGREGAAFLGWYTTRECTTKFNFADALTADTELYGKYAAAAGQLPTVRDGAPGEEASWSFDRGTLTIRCDAEGAEITTLWNFPENGDINSTPRTGYWSPLRDKVEKVVIEDNVRVQKDLRFWFSGMTNLVDVSEFKFPAGTTDVTHLFAQCSSLTSLPDDFVIPDHVINLDGLFLGTGLESLPASFKLPPNATILSATFGSCKLTSLPDGFTLPSKAVTTSYLFSQTPLKELPSTFRLPEGLENCGAMFESCTNLVSLPAGFTIPAKVTESRNMFYQCTSLVALPEGFAFADSSVLKNVAGMFSGCLSLTTLPASLDLRGVPSTCEGLNSMFSVGSPCSTYVVGGDLTKLAIAGNDAASYWIANYKRTLVTDVASLGGAVTVTFKTKVAGQADWSTYMTVLTDTTGKVPDPGARSQFGYAFDGWRTEAGEVFDFGTHTVTQATVLYGTLTPIVRLEVPSKVRVNVAADGTLTPGVARVRSYTPEPVAFTLDCTEANAASEVLPRAEDRAVLAVEVGVGMRTYQVYLGEAVSSSSFCVPAATGSAMPGELELSLGLKLPPNVRINFLDDGWSTDVAQLTYRAAVVAA